MNMNGREKILFILLAAVVILMGGFKLLIEPEMKNLAKVSTDYATALENKKVSQSNILKFDIMKKDDATIKENIKSIVSPFFPEVKNDKIHIYFQNIADATSINFTSLNMSPAVVAQITNPTKQSKPLSYPALDAAENIINVEAGKPLKAPVDNSKKTKPATNTKQQPIDALELMTVTIQFSGTNEQAVAFLDAIKNSGRVARVASYSMSIGEGENNTVIYSIVVECFGVKKFTEGDPFSVDSLIS